MIDFTDIILNNLVIHKVGNKMRNEGYIISNNTPQIDDIYVRETLLKYFLTPFKATPSYRFFHETDINLNEVYTYLKVAFNDSDQFCEQATNILKHLYNNSTHPHIKSGEFYMAYFSNCLINNVKVDAIGIFKSENKDTYLKILEKNKGFNVYCEKGIDIRKLDKGCIVYNMEAETGFRVDIVDSTNNEQAQYWKEKFLNLRNVEDDKFHTETYLRIYDKFCEQNYNNHNKEEKLRLKSKAISYFSNNENFDFDKFAEKVIVDREIISEFKSYKENYEYDNRIETKEAFCINPEAVQKARKNIKNTIKLDNRIEIKIKGSMEDIQFPVLEKGFDEKLKKHYYKIYFDHEQ
ncbi:nucleoid-associated protein [Aneurinibacillus aneurinilyticus]|nr:nucleoid-associated protein [Aneurinibacillus aneurinilyticus]MED0709760.1 nucleoid-associated protein [Aneurinibacillus aneurinilyticus]MED0726489.1 nucleoid-associated protein [Aneurinibacillus aneurinilyticus]MED0735357.1 nucleoid-associated protein [Aneurinibacillus aneurinilyticus]MED0743623.1 nucleoid-associated protein [Aneurinibacillus aneurinilyticus]